MKYIEMKKFNSLNENMKVEKKGTRSKITLPWLFDAGELESYSDSSSSPVAGCGGKKNSRRNTESRGPGWIGKALVGFAGSGWGVQKRFWTVTPPRYRERREKRWETPRGGLLWFPVKVWGPGCNRLTPSLQLWDNHGRPREKHGWSVQRFCCCS